MINRKWAGPLRGAVTLFVLALGVSCITVKGGKEGVRNAEAAERLLDFARAVETLDANKVADFYAKDAFSEVLDRSPRHTTGHQDLHDAVARTLGPVAALHVQPVGEERAWRDGDHAWTIQDFHVSGTLKDGRGFTLDVHYSAVWRRVEKRWLIEYEHLMGPPPVPRTTAGRPA